MATFVESVSTASTASTEQQLEQKIKEKFMDAFSIAVSNKAEEQIKNKIKEDQKNSDTKIEGDTASKQSLSLDPSLEKQIDFWDSLGEEE